MNIGTLNCSPMDSSVFLQTPSNAGKMFTSNVCGGGGEKTAQCALLVIEKYALALYGKPKICLAILLLRTGPPAPGAC